MNGPQPIQSGESISVLVISATTQGINRIWISCSLAVIPRDFFELNQSLRILPRHHHQESQGKNSLPHKDRDERKGDPVSQQTLLFSLPSELYRLQKVVLAYLFPEK